MNVIRKFSIRPKRKIFYMNPSQEDIDAFYHGVIPEQVAKYNDAFGTYGDPGLFLIKKDERYLKVIGIEYRPDDSRISYPEDLEEILWPSTFYRYDIIFEDAEDTLSDAFIMNYIGNIGKPEPVYYSYMEGKIAVHPNPEMIQVYMSDGECRLMVSAEYTPDCVPETQQDELCSRYKEMYYHDSITGYYNWNYLWLRILGYSLYGIQDYAFVFFDIKDFNAVNVVYGHIAANELLVSIVRQMEKFDWIYYSARCDNDNFAMMIKDMSKEETTEKLEKFFEGISYLKEDANYTVYYRCAVVPMKSTVELGAIVADAGKQAKAFGTKPFKTEIIFYTDSMRLEQERTIRLRNYLDTAIERDEFLIHLQPKYDIHTEKIKGAEALVRWKYKGKKMLSPVSFIPLFEAGGLISKLDDIVLGKVCFQLKEWEKQGKKLYPISVNISRKSVGIPEIAEHLTEIVNAFGVDHSLIEFELTESAAYDNQENMVSVMTSLKNKGFRISMDDFGTGYSSLSLLSIMPIDTLKIDKSFVDRIGVSDECTKSCIVVKQIIALAKELDLLCLAEGAEEKEQVDLLREFGCEIVQGYYYSKPLPVEEYEKLL
ncbi:MAG: GGDEF domain-containing phosphodiesterase [bacterium]|nr:GGDEF domain-containing phosphodiesterase [bacterium]